jgi:hypothetical protein
VRGRAGAKREAWRPRADPQPLLQALGWDAGEGGLKLEQDLFATWSLFGRK